MSTATPPFHHRLLAACLLLGALGASVAQAETSLERIKSSGTIRIGYANEAPFAFTDTSGKVTGESPEIATQVFKQMGIDKVEPVLTEWGALIPGLRAGRFDVIAAGMYITPPRCKLVLFTDPHYQIPDTLLVPKGNPKNLHSYADIAKDPSLRLAVMSGTVELGYARQSGVKDEQIVQVPDTTAQLQAVRAGRADASVGTALTMKGLAAKGGEQVEAVTNFKDDPAHTGYGALAFRPEDKDLRDAVNQQLKTWLGSEEHLKTVEPFGFDRSNLTDKTAAALCSQS